MGEETLAVTRRPRLLQAASTLIQKWQRRRSHSQSGGPSFRSAAPAQSLCGLVLAAAQPPT